MSRLVGVRLSSLGLAVGLAVWSLGGQVAQAITVPSLRVTVESKSFDVSTSSFTLVATVENLKQVGVDLSGFNLLLRVTPTSPRTVMFDSTTQPDTLSAANYVFLNDSDSSDNSLTPWSVRNSAGTDDEYAFSDLTTSNFLTLAPGAIKTLANIRMVLGTGAAAPVAGDVFTLTIGSTTEFTDGMVNPILYSKVHGTLTATGGGVVPEPGTWVLAGVGLAGVLGESIRRRRRQG